MTEVAGAATDDARVQAGSRAFGTIRTLTAQNIDEPSPANEVRLVRLRHQAFASIDRRPGRDMWPPAYDDPFPDLVDDVPEVPAEQLSAELLGGAVLHHGCLLVRHLVPAAEAEALAGDVHRAFEARERHLAGEHTSSTTPWYHPFKPDPEYPAIPPFRRKWVRDGGALWAADSPRVLFEVLQHFERCRLVDVIGEYLGERPAMTVNKSTLRCVTPTAYPSWHQDGAFMGTDLRAMNVWIALTPCGADLPAPALEVIPRRIEEIAETGTEGAMVNNEVGPGVVDRVAAGARPRRPRFEPGDALLFDERFLHRTSVREDTEGDRYAIEWWCFAPSGFPDDYLPLAL